MHNFKESQSIINTKEIGIIIKKRRQYLKVKQQELTDLADVGINTLAAIEHRQGKPKLETFLTILDTLGLQVEIRLKN